MHRPDPGGDPGDRRLGVHGDAGAGLLAVYSLGLGLPFIIAAFAVEPFAAFLARFRAHLVHVERVMGALLVLTGIAFLAGFFTELNNWMLEAFPGLQNIG